jgi:hypothetical protein
MNSTKAAFFFLILGFLLTSIAAPILPDKLKDGPRLRWDNVTGVSNEGYLDWYTYKITIDGSKSAKLASKETTIEKKEKLNFRWKMDPIVGNAILIFKAGSSSRTCDAKNCVELVSIDVDPGDKIQWNFMNSNSTENVQAWIAIAPEGKKAIEIPPPPIPETPSGPDRGYTNQPCTFSTNSVDSSEDIDYQFEFDGNSSDPTEEAKADKIWTTPGQKKVKVKAINKQGKASNWSKPKTVVIFEQIPVTENLQGKLNGKISYAEFVLQKDQEVVDELVISGKNNISIRSENGNKFKLKGQTARSKLKIINSENISINNLDISNPGSDGIELQNSDYSMISDNTVIFGLKKRGISILGNNNIVKDNIFENETGACSGTSDGIAIEQGANNIILNNIIKRDENQIICSYILNTTGQFNITVLPNPNDFPISLYIGYTEPNYLCKWYINGTIICKNHKNGNGEYLPDNNDNRSCTFERKHS